MGGKRIVNARLCTPAAANQPPQTMTMTPPEAAKPSRTGLHRQLQKTKLCIYRAQGTCKYGAHCSFAHSQTDLEVVPDLHRTRLCAAFAEGTCENPDCTFAHGEQELRSTGMFHKKAVCMWHAKGKCRNGESCRFAHGRAELRGEQKPSQGMGYLAAVHMGHEAMERRHAAFAGDHAARVAVEERAAALRVQMSAAAFVETQVAAQRALAAQTAHAAQFACAEQAAQGARLPPPPPPSQQMQQHSPLPVGRVAAHAGDFDDVALPQRWASAYQHAAAMGIGLSGPWDLPAAQQRAGQQQPLYEGEANAQRWPHAAPPMSREPMKITSTNLMRSLQAQQTEPLPAAPLHGIVPQQLVTLSELAVRLHNAGLLAPTAPAGPAIPATDGLAAGSLSAATDALAALAALPDLDLANQQHGNADLTSELGKLCEGIASLKLQCDRLQQQVQSQAAGPRSNGSGSTTDESLPPLGGFTRNTSPEGTWSEGFSRQTSAEVGAGLPARIVGNAGSVSLDARDASAQYAAAQYAAAFRLVAGLQQQL